MSKCVYYTTEAGAQAPTSCMQMHAEERRRNPEPAGSRLADQVSVSGSPSL